MCMHNHIRDGFTAGGKARKKFHVPRIVLWDLRSRLWIACTVLRPKLNKDSLQLVGDTWSKLLNTRVDG